MQTELDQTLRDVTAEVLESMAFVLTAMDDAGPDADEADDKIAGQIGFAGPFAGSLNLRLSRSLLTEVASNMLGLDFGVEASDEHQCDAFKELMNVVCGNLLPRLAGEEAVFDVGTPRILPDEAPATAEPAAGQQVYRTKLALEGGMAELALTVPAVDVAFHGL